MFFFLKKTLSPVRQLQVCVPVGWLLFSQWEIFFHQWESRCLLHLCYFQHHELSTPMGSSRSDAIGFIAETTCTNWKSRYTTTLQYVHIAYHEYASHGVTIVFSPWGLRLTPMDGLRDSQANAILAPVSYSNRPFFVGTAFCARNVGANVHFPTTRKPLFLCFLLHPQPLLLCFMTSTRQYCYPQLSR